MAFSATAAQFTDGKQYMYVLQESSGVKTYCGAPAVWSQVNYTVTPDISDAGSLGEGFAGVFTMYNADADCTYLWVQTKGMVACALVSTTIAAFDLLYAGPEDVFESRSQDFDSTSEAYPDAVGMAFIAKEAGFSGVHSAAEIVLF